MAWLRNVDRICGGRAWTLISRRIPFQVANYPTRPPVVHCGPLRGCAVSPSAKHTTHSLAVPPTLPSIVSSQSLRAQPGTALPHDIRALLGPQGNTSPTRHLAPARSRTHCGTLPTLTNISGYIAGTSDLASSWIYKPWIPHRHHLDAHHHTTAIPIQS